MAKTAVVKFQKEANEDVFFRQLHEICTQASNDGWNVLPLNANYIDIHLLLDKMEKDRRERIEGLVDEAENC